MSVWRMKTSRKTVIYAFFIMYTFCHPTVFLLFPLLSCLSLKPFSLIFACHIECIVRREKNLYLQATWGISS